MSDSLPSPFLASFRHLPPAASPEDGAPGEPAWLTEFRAGALARFHELGLPSRRQEEWRFTNLRRLEETAYPPATGAPEIDAAAINRYWLDLDNFRMIFVNGRGTLGSLGRPIALKPGAFFASTAPANAELIKDKLGLGEARGSQPFAALNAALFTDGFTLLVPEGMAVDRPLEILHWGEAAEPLSAHTRNILHLAPGSSATLVETFAGRGRYWTNHVTQIVLGEGARLTHIVLQDESGEAVHTALIRARLAAGARLDSFTLTLGGALSRRDLQIAIEGAGARCALDGAYMLSGSQEATTATLVDHAAPGGSTREVFMGVVEERSHGTFQGKIAVRPEAQKTDAHQLNKNLLLGPRAVVDTKPELEIYADDVKCSHGATVGDLDEGALFYLRARGIPEAEARRMLIDAFAGAAIDLVEEAPLRAWLRRHLGTWLADRQG